MKINSSIILTLEMDELILVTKLLCEDNPILSESQVETREYLARTLSAFVQGIVL